MGIGRLQAVEAQLGIERAKQDAERVRADAAIAAHLTFVEKITAEKS